MTAYYQVPVLDDNKSFIFVGMKYLSFVMSFHFMGLYNNKYAGPIETN